MRYNNKVTNNEVAMQEPNLKVNTLQGVVYMPKTKTKLKEEMSNAELNSRKLKEESNAKKSN